MTDIPSAKWAIRREVVARILAMDPAARRRQEAELHGRLPELPGFEGAGLVLLFASAFPEEYDTFPILRRALGQGKRVACPRVDRATGRLRLYLIEDPARDFQPGMMGIPEPLRERPEISPASIDWALVPGLAFDDDAYRLGRGRGHYDRLLPALPLDCPRWALALDPQWIDALPREPHDQPLDGVAGPGRTLERDRPRPDKISGL